MGSDTMTENLLELPSDAIITLPSLDVLPDDAVFSLPESGPITTPLEAPEVAPSPFEDDPVGPLEVGDERFVPRLTLTAAKAGVSFDKPAPVGHFLSSLAIDKERRVTAFSKALSDRFGSKVKTRIGKKTGEIEYLDPETNRWTLTLPPDSGMEIVEGMGGPLMTVGGEAIAGIATAIFSRSPALVTVASSGGAFAGEVIRLTLGRQMGVNEGVSDGDIIKAAAQEAGIALAGGLVADRLVRVGKFFIDAASGRVLPKSTLDALDTGAGGPDAENLFSNVDEAADVARRVNEVVTETKLKFNMAQTTNDEELLVLQDYFRRSSEYRAEFGAFEAQQQKALQEFQRVINLPYRARSPAAAPGEAAQATTGEAGERVQDVARAVVEGRQVRQDVLVKTAEAQLDDAVIAIPDRPFEGFGNPVREFVSGEQEAFREWADDAARNLHRLSGGTEFIPNRRTLAVVNDIDATVSRALFPSVQQPQRRLIGNIDLTEIEGTDGEMIEAIGNKIFDPEARYTFQEAWEAISALKRVTRTASKGLSTDEPEVGAVKRLYQALEGDLREAAQASPLREQYDLFRQQYRVQKTRLDKGIVGQVMRRREGGMSPFVVADEKVFREFFTPGTNREANELFALIGNNPEQMQGMREAIGDFYKRAVMEGGRVDPRKHAQFMRAYQRPMSVFFQRDEILNFARVGQAEKVVRARTEARKSAVQRINKSFEADLANLNNPGKVVGLIMDPNNPDKTRQLVSMLKDTPDVLRGVRAEFRKEMAERSAGTFQGGERMLSPANFDRFLNGKSGEKGFRGVATQLFGDEYVNNLDTLNAALKIASRETKFPNRSNTAFWADTVKNLARAYVGLFTRPGRMITALDRFRGRAGNRVLMRAIMNPEDARKLLELKGVDMRSRQAIRIIGAMGGTALLESFE